MIAGEEWVGPEIIIQLFQLYRQIFQVFRLVLFLHIESGVIKTVKSLLPMKRNSRNRGRNREWPIGCAYPWPPLRWDRPWFAPFHPWRLVRAYDRGTWGWRTFETISRRRPRNKEAAIERVIGALSLHAKKVLINVRLESRDRAWISRSATRCDPIGARWNCSASPPLQRRRMRATVGSVERTGKNLIYTLVIKRKRRGYRTNIPVSETSGGHFVRLDWARSQIKLPVCAGRHTNIVPLAPAYRYQIVLKWSVPGGRDVFKQRPESFGAQITESEKRRFIITKRGRVLVTAEFKRLKRSFSSVPCKIVSYNPA